MGAVQSSPFSDLGLPRGRLQLRRPAILWYSTEEQAKAADRVCKSMASNNVFLEDQRANMNTSSDNWNATSIGNMAYLALHCSEEHRAFYKAAYNEMVHRLRDLHANTYTEEFKARLANCGIMQPENL